MSFLPLLEPASMQSTRAISKRIATTSCAMLVLLYGPLASAESANAATSASKPASGSFTGMAHYYADRLHGKRTASGQVHDRNKMTAAHRSLPFGTRLHVTNKKNGKTCEVVVNDRGPFHPKFNLDLSQAAARELGFMGAGKGLLECIIMDDKAVLDGMKVAKQPQAKPAAAQQAAPPDSTPAQTGLPLAVGIARPAVQAKTASAPVVPVVKVMPVMVDEAVLAQAVAEAKAARTQAENPSVNDQFDPVFSDQSSDQNERQGILNPANEIADNVKAQNIVY